MKSKKRMEVKRWKEERRKKKEERDVNGDGAKLLSWGQASLPLTE